VHESSPVDSGLRVVAVVRNGSRRGGRMFWRGGFIQVRVLQDAGYIDYDTSGNVRVSMCRS
jgi:hypothetical protein